jgi:hypothetical protein
MQVIDIIEEFRWFRSEWMATMVSQTTMVSQKWKTRSGRPQPESAARFRLVADLRALHEKSYSHLAKNSW